MAKPILICGRICCGKTTYARRLIEQRSAVLLSCDEITLALFGQYIGEKHDEIVESTERYLFGKSLEILETGIDVILDFGFWTRTERDQATAFYKTHGYVPEWHYIDVADEVWRRGIQKRNGGMTNDDYFVDDNLAEKFLGMFEKPEKSEIDVWYRNEW